MSGFVHISNHADVKRRLKGRKWRECLRKPEKLRYIVLKHGGAVETAQGTMSLPGKAVLMEGGTGRLYLLEMSDFKRCCETKKQRREKEKG